MVVSRQDKGVLEGVPVFKGLSPKGLEYIQSVASKKKYEAGEMVFYQGEKTERLFILGSGKVEVFKMGLSGKKLVLWNLYDREVFCLASLYCGTTFASAQCVTESTIFSISKAALSRLLSMEPHVGINMMQCISSKLSYYAVMVDDFAFKDLTHRLARLLFEHSINRERGEGICSMGLDEMAARLGTSVEVVSRALKKLKKKGIVKRKGKRLLQVDKRAMEKEFS